MFDLFKAAPFTDPELGELRSGSALELPRDPSAESMGGGAAVRPPAASPHLPGEHRT